MDELRRDLAVQQAAREELLVRAEKQQRLLAIDAEQAEKIRRILAGETTAMIRAERRQQWMFLTLGAFVSIPIGVAINLLVPGPVYPAPGGRAPGRPRGRRRFRLPTSTRSIPARPAVPTAPARRAHQPGTPAMLRLRIRAGRRCIRWMFRDHYRGPFLARKGRP
ncbi:hypothetical protein ACWDUI_23075 [Streptosporangium sandarakinum]|uniref:hypothetical protein n=1 Tax=Streptosporangium sandarakinum TaxID=1260955 RepID=UPI003D945049